jgi:hypothetical protein
MMDDSHRRKGIRHGEICNGFLGDCGYEIVADVFGLQAIPVEMEDN